MVSLYAPWNAGVGIKNQEPLQILPAVWKSKRERLATRDYSIGVAADTARRTNIFV